MHYQYDYIAERTYFLLCEHGWLQAKFSSSKLELHSKISYENYRALNPENSAQSDY